MSNKDGKTDNGNKLVKAKQEDNSDFQPINKKIKTNSGAVAIRAKKASMPKKPHKKRTGSSEA